MRVVTVASLVLIFSSYACSESPASAAPAPSTSVAQAAADPPASVSPPPLVEPASAPRPDPPARLSTRASGVRAPRALPHASARASLPLPPNVSATTVAVPTAALPTVDCSPSCR